MFVSGRREHIRTVTIGKASPASGLFEERQDKDF